MQSAQPGVVDPALGDGDGKGRSMPRFTDECRIERLPLDDGLTLVRSFCCPRSDLTEKTDQSDGRPTLVITFGLSGESAYVERAGTHLRFRQGHTTLSVFASCQGERQFAASTPVRQLRLSVGETALRRYLGAPDALLPHRTGVCALGERVTSPWCPCALWPTRALLHTWTPTSPRSVWWANTFAPWGHWLEALRLRHDGRLPTWKSSGRRVT